MYLVLKQDFIVKMATVKRVRKSKPIDDIEEVDLDIADEDTIDLDDTESEKKRRPGRPRKNVPRKKIERTGLVDKPEDSDYSIELIYENPMMFKKIFALFKAYGIQNIHMTFDHTGVCMFSISKERDIKIFIEIFGNKLNSYYCARDLTVTVDTENFNNIFQSINKDFSKIILATTRQQQSSRIFMHFVDEENEKSQYEIELSPNANNVNETCSQIGEILKLEQQYPIAFDLPSKYLKHKITEYGNLKTNKICIQQEINNNDREIFFSCETLDRKISNKSPLTNTNKMNLQSTYDSPWFIAPIFITNLRPLANSLISDKLRLSVDEQRDLICTSWLDGDVDEKTKNKLADSDKCRVRVIISLAKTQQKDENHIK